MSLQLGKITGFSLVICFFCFFIDYIMHESISLSTSADSDCCCCHQPCCPAIQEWNGRMSQLIWKMCLILIYTPAKIIKTSSVNVKLIFLDCAWTPPHPPIHSECLDPTLIWCDTPKCPLKTGRWEPRARDNGRRQESNNQMAFKQSLNRTCPLGYLFRKYLIAFKVSFPVNKATLSISL